MKIQIGPAAIGLDCVKVSGRSVSDAAPDWSLPVISPRRPIDAAIRFALLHNRPPWWMSSLSATNWVPTQKWLRWWVSGRVTFIRLRPQCLLAVRQKAGDRASETDESEMDSEDLIFEAWRFDYLLFGHIPPIPFMGSSFSFTSPTWQHSCQVCEWKNSELKYFK